MKIGLAEFWDYVDRNGNGSPDTSYDANNDGNIDASEMLPWGEDEAVLYELSLVPGWEGAYAPGTYPGTYDNDYWGVAPRGLAIDKNNDLWAGTWSTSKYFHVDGATGAILSTLDVSGWGHHAYGAVIDADGILWSSYLYGHVLAVNTNNLADISKIDLGHTYGIGMDYAGGLFVGGGGQLSRIDRATRTVQWTIPANAVQGVVCTTDNDVWVAGNYLNRVTRYLNDGTSPVDILGFSTPTGVAVDAAGKVWACDFNSDFIHRIDPATNSIDLSKQVIGSGGHYSYSDMTGMIARSVTTKVGSWTVTKDSGVAAAPWKYVAWTCDEPLGTSVRVQVRSSEDGTTWSAWETAVNGAALSATPAGRYLQVEATLQISSGEVSPVLYDLTVCSDDEGPVTTDVVPAPSVTPVGSAVSLTANVDDVATGNSNIASAEYSINGGAWSPMSATDASFDSPTEDVTVSLGTFATPGVYSVCVRGTDDCGNVGDAACAIFVVYDPNGGFVTGGGRITSPEGAWVEDPMLSGPATFGFVSKYQKGASIPTGNTQFQFHAAGMDFKSTSYQWLVISGPKAQYKGLGTINGAGTYGFILTAWDGGVTGGGGLDRIRLKVWDPSTSAIVYDTQLGAADGDAPTAVLEGGSIIIHKK